jgi:hypothetical protein
MDEQKRLMLEWRNIEPGRECNKCGGSGGIWYGNTTTWRGGIGGQSMTYGVCNVCWGSGDRYHAWVDLRKLKGA